MFEIGDDVIGFTSDSQNPNDADFDGRFAKITQVYPDGNPPHVRVHYEDGDFWFYNLDDIQLAKNYVINQILNEL